MFFSLLYLDYITNSDNFRVYPSVFVASPILKGRIEIVGIKIYFQLYPCRVQLKILTSDKMSRLRFLVQ